MGEERRAMLDTVRQFAEGQRRELQRQLAEALGGQARRLGWELGRALDGLPPIDDTATLRARLVAEEWRES